MEQWFFNLIRKAEQMHLFSSILRLSLSILCGGILGIERGKANRSAGMRTYSLVCMSAALVMLTGEYMYEAFGTGDPARLGAQVVSGIGFLGAGSIIIEGNTKIRGLTTAAGFLSFVLPVPPVLLIGRALAVLSVVDRQTVDVEHAPVHLTALGQAVPPVELLRILAPEGRQGGTADALQMPGHAYPHAGDGLQLRFRSHAGNTLLSSIKQPSRPLTLAMSFGP